MSSKTKKPAGTAATTFMKKFQKKNIMLLKKAPIYRICRRELARIFGKKKPKLVSRGFIHALMSITQKHVCDRLEMAYKSAKFVNSVDENGEPLMVTENNLKHVLALLGERPWPVRPIRQPKKNTDVSMENSNKIKEKIAQSAPVVTQ